MQGAAARGVVAVLSGCGEMFTVVGMHENHSLGSSVGLGFSRLSMMAVRLFAVCVFISIGRIGTHGARRAADP